VSYNPLLTASSYELLAKLVKDERCELEKLSLEGNQMGNKNLKIVTDTLSDVKFIKSLNVSKNKLTCEGAKSISSLITCCANKLQVLLIHYNQIMGKGG